MMNKDQDTLPGSQGHFGEFGGRFVAETLMHALEELHEAYGRWRKDEEFIQRMDEDLARYVGRPSPIYYARRYTAAAGGAKIYLKREDLNHTGAHKINNTLGQGLLARHMGKKRVIAETGAGATRCRHGNGSGPIGISLVGFIWVMWIYNDKQSMFTKCICSELRFVAFLPDQRH